MRLDGHGRGLLAFDLDGTVLTPFSHEGMSGRVARALEAASDAGYVVVMATGRPRSEIGPDIWNLPWLRWRICSSGAVVFRAGSEEAVERRFIERDVLSRAVSLVGGACERILVETPDSYLVQPVMGSPYKNGWIPAAGVLTDDAVVEAGDHAHKLMVHFASSDERAAAQVRVSTLSDRCVVANEGEDSLEVSPAGCSKASSAIEICRLESLAPDHGIAFGDSGNDLSFSASPLLFVAMGNAEPHVLAAADEVCPDVYHDGVAVWIEKNLLS